LAEEKASLQRVSGLTADEAKELLLSRMEDEVREEAVVMIKRVENETKAVAEKKAKEIGLNNAGLAYQQYGIAKGLEVLQGMCE